jgi:hypothetical protein
VGGWGGKIVIPMPEALSFAESRRQQTLDLPYLTLLCDNLINRMFLQNFFFLNLFREFVSFFQLSTPFHYSTAKQFHYGL